MRTVRGQVYEPGLGTICVSGQLTLRCMAAPPGGGWEVGWAWRSGEEGAWFTLGQVHQDGCPHVWTHKYLGRLGECVGVPGFRVCRDENYQWQHGVCLCPSLKRGSLIGEMQGPTDLRSHPQPPLTSS